MTTSQDALARMLARAQHRIAFALGVDEHHRTHTVAIMLANNARRAPGYWIQLLLATGIATLGLVLNSTAVVIGAMLVSPLMGPIVELGMGLAVGSALLVMRAGVRVGMSVAVAVGFAALLTLALPFHELTAEISARAAPTALDLLVAVFCALTASYTTVRPGADSTAAAAGTAVGIALVPPLCAIGFGLGTAAPEIASGAALLFTANLSAILGLSVVSFLLLGFHRVDAAVLEHDFLDRDETGSYRLATRLHLRLRELFGTRYGIAMRVVIPILFLAAVYAPLRRALDEVTWEVRARDAVRRIVREESPGAVQTQMTLERRALSLRLLIVGTTARAVSLERGLTARLGALIGGTPTVTVVAVPNARTLLAEQSAAARAAVPATPAPPSVDELRARAAAVLADAWPAEAGPVLGWELSLPAHDSALMVVRHAGAPFGPAGERLLARALSAGLRSPVALRVSSLPGVPFVSASGRERAWLDTATTMLTEIVRTDSAVACVRGPIARARRRTAAQRAILSALRRSAGSDSARVTIDDGAHWEIRAAAGTCAPAGAARAPAGE
ncbi:MAG: DUF389 domain-containing protein [Gemmatimonadaceae bacterium]